MTRYKTLVNKITDRKDYPTFTCIDGLHVPSNQDIFDYLIGDGSLEEDESSLIGDTIETDTEILKIIDVHVIYLD